MGLGWVRGCKRQRGTVALRALRFPFDAALDFLVEDNCALCRRPHRTRAEGGPHSEPTTARGDGEGGGAGEESGGPSPAAPSDGPARFLIGPVPVRCLMGVVTVVNHPVCVDCAGDFVVATTPGVILDRPRDGVGATRGEGGGGEVRGAGPRATPAGGAIDVVSPFMTTDGVLKMIHLLKFDGYTGLAVPIGRALAWSFRRFAGTSGGFGPLVPTPLDERSRRKRGFNQAERIARVLAAEVGASVADVLLKTVRTRRQSLTPRDERLTNVLGAFSCTSGATSIIGGRRVVLVDDLVTSGATAGVCANALLGAGAASVTVACFGRAL